MSNKFDMNLLKKILKESKPLSSEEVKELSSSNSWKKLFKK